MDCSVVVMFALLTLQIFSVIDIIVSLVTGTMYVNNGSLTSQIQMLTTCVLSLTSLSLTLLQTKNLRRLRRYHDKFDRVYLIQSRQTIERRGSIWVLCLAAVHFILKYIQILEFINDKWYNLVVTTVIQTMSVTANCYVTNIFMNNVLLTKRLLHVLINKIINLYGLSSSSHYVHNDFSTIRSMYLDIHKTCIIIMKVFQTQLFLCIIDNVYGITFMMLAANNILMSNEINSSRITLSCLYESIVRAFQIFFIVYVCYTTSEQARTIPIMLQQKNNECYSLLCNVKKKVNDFVLEMLDLKIDFIIYGFIQLDFAMFISIMGSIVTYLLILVQLKTASASVTLSKNDTIRSN
ncbi:uncharacterized protein LOC126897602 [Daktulosphaira vitifoliae]|uniref:uncharacterized protein LOC126897602 n=1 Tax=Daktulosphaira vitifoliae TaxID=58002 RepID=UPI0021A9C056|nr:uncharacterized protein LOC126897602 [Daktulosphaira vitifoliae]